MKKFINTYLLLSGIIASVGLTGCNSGSSNTQESSLGSLTLTIANRQLTTGESTVVTASLHDSIQGGNAIGAVTMKFHVSDTYGIIESSSIATVQPESCVINNPVESTVTSCSVTLTATAAGSSLVHVDAIPANITIGSRHQSQLFEVK